MLVWLVVCILLLANAARNIAVGQFPDPDDVLRLIQVRDLLAGQGWFDLNQHRIDPAGETPMHWSRLVDLPLAIVIAALTPLLGAASAETAGVVLVPLLIMLATMLLIGRLAWRLFDTETAGFACLAFGFLPLLVFQFQPMRIDHHGWQIFTVATALYALHFRQARRGGALAGLAMAAGLLISLELLPVAAIFGGVLAVRWLRDNDERPWLIAYLQSLAVSLLALFAITRGFADLTPYCDAITLPHIGLFAAVALGVTGLAAPHRLSWPLTLAGFAVAATAGLAVFGASSPECLRTPFGELDPLVRDFWYVNVLEGRPLWDQPVLVVPQLFQLSVALVVVVHLGRSSTAWKRDWWREYLLIFTGTLLLGLLVWRSMAFASVLATIPLGYLLKAAFMKLRRARLPKVKLLIVLGLATILIPSVPLLAAMSIAAPKTDEGNRISGPLDRSSCKLSESSARLAQLETGVIYAPLDIGPAILQQSPHAVVATGHHRAESAMHDIIAGFLAPPKETHAIMQKHGARYVVICTDILEPNLYANIGERGSFASRLMAEDPPDWLQPIDLGTPDTFRVWRVVD